MRQPLRQAMPDPPDRSRALPRHRARRLTLALLVGVALAATAWAACPMAGRTPAANAGTAPAAGSGAAAGAGAAPLLGQAADTPNLQHAENLFVGTCAACHGIHGQGAGMPGLGFPPLDATSGAWQKSDTELQLIIQGGKGTMPGVGASWKKSDIRDVLALLRSWWTPQQQAQHDALSKASNP